MFNKQGSKPDADTTGAKRDVTIVNEPKKRPDHVRVESHDCAWSIPLTLEEQYDLGQVYENGFNYEEREMLRNFVEGMYAATAARITLEIKPMRPGEVSLKASSDAMFTHCTQPEVSCPSRLNRFLKSAIGGKHR